MEKDTVLRLRLSAEDKEKIQARAVSEGMKISAYARKMLLFGEVIKISPEEQKMLSGVANNLNQLTRHYNQTGECKPELETVLKTLIDELRNAYRKR